MAEKGLISAPNAAVGMPFQVGGAQIGTYPGADIGLDKP
jgi:hypothetical protein